VADVGTGAGFPGLPLAIVRPDVHVTLMDALNKRLAFLADATGELDVTNVTLVHARAEDAGRDPAHRDRYDLVVARAVAGLPTLLEWCGPLVRAPGGRFVAMKSAGIDDELAASSPAAQALHLRLTRDVPLTLAPPVNANEGETGSDDGEPLGRRLLVWEKTRPTPARYPRRAAEIKARPLLDAG
jgi:16S rRNA (guanine527-N7)-methyltransferase